MKNLAFGLGALAAAGLAIACSDSLHLDPPAGASSSAAGTGGSSSSSSSSVSVGSTGGGGDAGPPIVCASNADCPAPKAICDKDRNECVECLEYADCAFRPGTVCSKGKCVCPTATDSYCEATPSRPQRCVDLETTTNDCGTCGHACFGACAMGACVDAWEPTPMEEAPSPRARPVVVWTGSELVVWSGEDNNSVMNTGGVLDLAEDKWTPTSTANAPSPRTWGQGVWTGTQLVVWGGYAGGPLGTGGIYDPAKNTWSVISTSNAPSPRYAHTMVWADALGKVVVWGGTDNNGQLDTGGMYDPKTDTWQPTNGGPNRRHMHTAVWTGAAMLIFGGVGFDGATEGQYLADGWSFDPTGNAWTSLTPDTAPAPRARQTAVWTGEEMLVWGGIDASDYRNDGAKYKVAETAWTTMFGGAPTGRADHTSVWVGGKMIVFGGIGNGGVTDSGGLYDPKTNSWSAKAMAKAPVARRLHGAVAAGTKMIVWGGQTMGGGVTNEGGVFDPAK